MDNYWHKDSTWRAVFFCFDLEEFSSLAKNLLDYWRDYQVGFIFKPRYVIIVANRATANLEDINAFCRIEGRF